MKGVDRLLKAFKLVQASSLQKMGAGKLETGLTLRIIGSGSEEKRLRQVAHELEITDSVQFLGRRSQEDVADEMRHADCLCLPSHSEGMPNVVVEALACGTPAVTVDAGEVRRLIRDGENGRVAVRRDPEAVAEAAEAVLKSRLRPEDIAASAAAYTRDALFRSLFEDLEKGRP